MWTTQSATDRRLHSGAHGDRGATGEAGAREPLDQLAYFGRLAHTAWERGQRAAAEGDHSAARLWLQRARRLAPEDGMVAFTLAMLLLARNDPAAAPLFEMLGRRLDRREAWLGLAAIRLGQGEPDKAAAAAAAALSRHAPDPAYAQLLDRIAEAAGAPGWCGLDGDGRLAIGGCLRPEAARIAIDGLPVTLPPDRLLPPRWADSTRVSVRLGGRPLLGSPLSPPAIRLVEGFAAASEGGIEGWAWHPGDPDRDPVLTLVGAGPEARAHEAGPEARAYEAGPEARAYEAGPEARTGGTRPEPRIVVADDPEMELRLHPPLSRPRRFRLDRAALAGLVAPLALIGSDGRRLLGTPVDPGAEARGAASLARAVSALFPAVAAVGGVGDRPVPAEPVTHAGIRAGLRGPAVTELRPPRPVAVVIPVYRGLAATRACIGSVLRTVPPGTQVIVVDDASPDPALAAAMRTLAAAGRIRLLRLDANRGFPGAANAGMRVAAGCDVVLLNSDTIVPPGWLERLREAATSAPDIGTVTPFSNDATILSYPRVGAGNPAPNAGGTARLAQLALRVNRSALVEVPTAVGFCMYIRRDCLDRVGLFREDEFAQGYGEENDFCLRARHLGFRHMAHPGAYVAHHGGASFGAAKAHLIARNLAVLERLHPGYGELVAEFSLADPLAPSRRRMDMMRWRAERRSSGAAILITHADGGGVRRRVREHCALLRATGLRPIVLWPAAPDVVAVGDTAETGEVRNGEARNGEASADRFPNLRFRLPGELTELAKFLRRDRPRHIEVHQLLGHHHSVMQLARLLEVPQDIYIHDYQWFCPRVALVGADRRYCGEPDIRACEACIADAGSNLQEDIPVAALVARSAADLRRARRVIAPSDDAAWRIRRHFPMLRPEVLSWEDDAAIAAPPPPLLARNAIRPGTRRRVLIPGAIGIEKGYDVLIACARDAAARDLPLEFVVVGFSSDDERLLATERAFVTGAYQEAEAEALMRAQGATLAFLPSIWPETWSYTLTQAWRAGLRVLAFDTGAPAARIRRTGWGWLLPLGMPAASINNALVGSAPLAVPATPSHHPRAASMTVATEPPLPA